MGKDRKTIVTRGSHERFRTDSLGRRWDFVQRVQPRIPRLGEPYLHWVCSGCGHREPVKYASLTCDEVVVPSSTDDLDVHDCDEERVRQILTS